MQVRTNGTKGNRLFDYDPKNNIVTIINNKTIYRVKLYDEYHGNRYKVIDRQPRDLKLKTEY